MQRNAVMGLLAYPIGIPLGFYLLLWWNNIPQMVKQKVHDAWLRELVAHAWSVGVLQPTEDLLMTTCETIPAEYVAVLYTYYCSSPYAREPPEYLRGVKGPKRWLALFLRSNMVGLFFLRLLRKLRKGREWPDTITKEEQDRRDAEPKCMDKLVAKLRGDVDEEKEQEKQRKKQVRELVRWAKKSHIFMIPPLRWAPPKEPPELSEEEVKIQEQEEAEEKRIVEEEARKKTGLFGKCRGGQKDAADKDKPAELEAPKVEEAPAAKEEEVELEEEEPETAAERKERRRRERMERLEMREQRVQEQLAKARALMGPKLRATMELLDSRQKIVRAPRLPNRTVVANIRHVVPGMHASPHSSCPLANTALAGGQRSRGGGHHGPQVPRAVLVLGDHRAPCQDSPQCVPAGASRSC